MLLTFCHCVTRLPFLHYPVTFLHFPFCSPSSLLKCGQIFAEILFNVSYPFIYTLHRPYSFLLCYPQSHCYISRFAVIAPQFQVQKIVLVIYYCVRNHLKIILFLVISVDQDLGTNFWDDSGLRLFIRLGFT